MLIISPNLGISHFQQNYTPKIQDQQFSNKMRSAGGLGGDITNRVGGPSFLRQFGTPGRNYKDDVSHTTFGQLENILEKERAKFRDVKQKLENELDTERKLRIEFENKLIKLKDEFSRKDVQISEFEFRENNILHQVQDYQIENDKMKTEIMRLEELFGGRVFELENELRDNRKQHDDVLQEYKTEFQKFKKEGMEYIETLNFEHDRKVKGLEDKCKGLEHAKRELTGENKKLNDSILHSRLSFEEEIRDVTNRLREEELRKTQFMTKSFEQRLRSVEDAKEVLARKINDLTRQLQDKDHQIQELENEKNDEIERLRMDVSDLEAKLTQINFLYEKSKNDIAQREAALNRNTGQNSHEVSYLKQQIDAKRKQVDQLTLSIKQLREAMKDQAGQFERKRNQLSDKSNFFESQARRYKEQNTRIYETLKAKISETISNVGNARK